MNVLYHLLHDVLSNGLSFFSFLTSSVSHLVVTTCHTSQPAGTKIEYDSNGQIKTKTSCAREVWATYVDAVYSQTLSIFQYIPVYSSIFQYTVGQFQYMLHSSLCVCIVQVGTTVTLHNLFHTLPVRHKEFQRNLKKVAVEHSLNKT